MKSEKKVAVIGLGRFGSFWASVLKDYFDVGVWSRSREHEIPKGCHWLEWDELFESDALFLCCAISAVPTVASQLAKKIQAKTVVVDTCSVKVYPLTELQRILPSGIEILGTHPMFGPDSAKNGLKNLPIVMSSVSEKKKTFDFWKSAFQKMELSVLEMTPEAHDQEAAQTQGLTHYIGRLLQEMDLKESAMGTKNYRLLLQIRDEVCRDDEGLFYQLQSLNSYASSMREQFDREVQALNQKIEARHLQSKTKKEE